METGIGNGSVLYAFFVKKKNVKHVEIDIAGVPEPYSLRLMIQIMTTPLPL